ncbi:MAG: TlpA disulfide reductase family protein [Ilumatobacteraceae bacterium]
MNSGAKKNRGGTSGKAVWTIGAIVVGVIAVAAIVSVTSSNDPESAPGTTSEYSAVTVTGDVLPAHDAAVADTAIGLVAPVLTGKGFAGNTVTTTAGTPTLLVFLAHWCPHCQAEVPRLVEWEKAGDVPAGVDVIGIATGSDPARPNYPPSAWLAREDFPALWPVMADSQERTAAQAFGLSGYPFFVLLDAEGKVVGRQSGEVPMADLTTWLETVATS